jgi:hypothetical protein
MGVRAAVLVTVMLPVVWGCAESVLFRSTPGDARVTVAGEPVGTTPVYYESRDVRPKPYRVEKAGYPSVEGMLGTRVSRGRIVGTIFTLGILRIFKQFRYFDPWIIDVQLGAEQPPAALLRLYNLKSAAVLEGECIAATATCAVTLESGEQCSGDYVRENQGTTVVSGSSQSVVGSGVIGIQTSQAAAGREAANMNKAVAVFRCQRSIIDCSLMVESATMRGHGECSDTLGGTYRVMLLPKPINP